MNHSILSFWLSRHYQVPLPASVWQIAMQRLALKQISNVEQRQQESETLQHLEDQLAEEELALNGQQDELPSAKSRGCAMQGCTLLPACAMM